MNLGFILLGYILAIILLIATFIWLGFGYFTSLVFALIISAFLISFILGTYNGVVEGGDSYGPFIIALIYLAYFMGILWIAWIIFDILLYLICKAKDLTLDYFRRA